jgi:hypothetical protein
MSVYIYTYMLGMSARLQPCQVVASIGHKAISLVTPNMYDMICGWFICGQVADADVARMLEKKHSKDLMRRNSPGPECAKLIAVSGIGLASGCSWEECVHGRVFCWGM